MEFQVKEILASIFNIDISQISDNAKIGELPGWDSLGHMRLVLHIEKIIKRSLKTEEILTIVDVQHVKDLLYNIKYSSETRTND